MQLSTKDYSNKQESMVASFLGWSKVAGSGAATCKAGDVISDKFLGECKTHETPGSKVTFRQDVWLKICDEAMVFGRIQLLLQMMALSSGAERTACLNRLLTCLCFLKMSFLLTLTR